MTPLVVMRLKHACIPANTRVQKVMDLVCFGLIFRFTVDTESRHEAGRTEDGIQCLI